MSWNNVIPVDMLLDAIGRISSAVQLHFDEELFIPTFEIPEEYIPSLNVRYTKISSTGHKSGIIASQAEHPAFEKLRQVLSNGGFIEIPPYPCWNGDRVRKAFYLNQVLFNPGETFFCGTAMSGYIKRKKQEKSNNLSYIKNSTSYHERLADKRGSDESGIQYTLQF